MTTTSSPLTLPGSFAASRAEAHECGPRGCTRFGGLASHTLGAVSLFSRRPNFGIENGVDKFCGRCRTTKRSEDFGVKDRSRGWLQPWCRECEREYKAAWYARHRAEHIEHVRVQRAATKEANRARILAYLTEHPCVGCGETNLVVLDFDHLRDKRRNVTYMVSAGFPWATIEKEIVKRQVLCANCHRIKTARERGFYDQKFRGQLFETPGNYRLVRDNCGGPLAQLG